MLATAGGAWVNMRGSIWRVASEQLRSATSEESMGAELVNRYLDHMRVDLKKARGARSYVDVAAVGPPRFPGDQDVDDDEEVVEEHPEDRSDSEPDAERGVVLSRV